MILIYALIGAVLSAAGGVPLGASNLAVISTTTKHSLSKGMKVAHAAGLGEVTLAFMALCYSSILADFFKMNPWIQAGFIMLFFAIGILLLFPMKFKMKIPRKKPGRKGSPWITGYLLALINPPVLLFWILGITLTQRLMIPISDMSPLLILLLFFTGVFTGKVFVLYLYARLGNRLQKRPVKNKTKLYRIVGVILILLASVQGVRFFADSL